MNADNSLVIRETNDDVFCLEGYWRGVNSAQATLTPGLSLKEAVRKARQITKEKTIEGGIVFYFLDDEEEGDFVLDDW